MSTAETAPRKADRRTKMWAGVLAGAALCYAISIPTSGPLGLGGYAPMVFGVPAALGFFLARRLRWRGATFIAIAIAAAYYAAYFAAVQVYSWASPKTCLFCTAAENLPAYGLAGLAGGLVGSLLSFLAFALIAPDLRDPRARRIAAVSIGLLTALGGVTAAVGLAYGGDYPLLGNFVLFTPWQLAFGAALIALLGRRTV